MPGQIIGDSVFSVHETGFDCGVGSTPHGKAVLEERRMMLNSHSIGYYCALHGTEQRDEATARRDRVRARRDW